MLLARATNVGTIPRHFRERNARPAINFREQQEKLNVWVALMNLENSYGTHESLMRVFERAVTYNEPKKIYMHLVNIYERTSKLDVRLAAGK